MAKSVILFSSLLMTLTACSHGGSGANDPQGGPTAQSYHESYQFKTETCDTGLHDFSSATSSGDVQKQLCDTLQDDALNASCAEAMRQDLFSKKCGGQTWTPKNNSRSPSQPSTPASAPTFDPGDRTSSAVQAKILSALQSTMVESYVIGETVPAAEKTATAQLGEDLVSCGLNILGPKCLDYEALSTVATFSNVDGKYVVYSELKMKGSSDVTALLFTIDQADPAVKIGRVEISKILKAPKNQTLGQYLKDPGALSLLLRITIAADPQAAALKRLQDPKNIRDLYHAGRLVVDAGKIGARVAKSAISDSVKKNQSLITTSADTRYQIELLNYLADTFSPNTDAVTDLCKALLNTHDDAVKEISAAILLIGQPTRTDLKTHVLPGLKNPSWAVRQKSVAALAKTAKSVAEESQILLMINDDVEAVSQQAADAADSIKVSEKHLDSVRQLAVSKNWVARTEAVKLLSRIDTDAANLTMIGFLADPVYVVEDAIFDKLKAKSLKESYLAALVKNYDSPSWSVRNHVSALIGKIAGANASSVLIEHMGDPVNVVSETIQSQLLARTLGDESLPALTKNFDNQDWQVRQNVAALLGKIKTPASFNALETQLTRETVASVREEINSSIAAIKN